MIRKDAKNVANEQNSKPQQSNSGKNNKGKGELNSFDGTANNADASPTSSSKRETTKKKMTCNGDPQESDSDKSAGSNISSNSSKEGNEKKPMNSSSISKPSDKEEKSSKEGNNSEKGSFKSTEASKEGNTNNSSDNNTDGEKKSESEHSSKAKEMEELAKKVQELIKKELTEHETRKETEEKSYEEDRQILEDIQSNNVNHSKVKYVIEQPAGNRSLYDVLFYEMENCINSTAEDLREKLKKNIYMSMKGLRSGSKVNINSYIVNKTACFERKKRPYETSLAVSIVIDESGSMNLETKLMPAVATAIFIYEVCYRLNIPCSIYGHSSSYPVMNIDKFIDFNSDYENRYSLGNARNKKRTRDGAAMLFAKGKLERRSENKKIMFVISDGQPNDSDGYGGEGAIKDIHNIINECEEQRIRVIPCSIDSHESVKRYYGSGCLKVENIENMRNTFIAFIEESINL